jgi:hypothetical protein
MKTYNNCPFRFEVITLAASSCGFRDSGPLLVVVLPSG